jgi:hypothetical protein
MATTLESALRLVKPGEMVVSLTEILDKLGNKLTDDEKQQLLLAMLSPRREKVQPGDLITTDLINQILVDVADLQFKVANLSAGTVSFGPPEIFRLNKGSVEMGEELQVIGRNLDIASLVYVKIADVSIDTFKADKSSSTLLVFDVPAIIGITDPGAMVNLEIKNTSGGPASASLFVKPGTSYDLNANFGFTVTAPSTPIPANGSGNYIFLIDATTSTDEQYLAVPLIDGGWTAQATPTTLTIPKSQTTPSKWSVSVRVTAPASGSATLKLELRPMNFPGKSYPSQNVPVAVNANTGGTNPDFVPISTDVFPASSNGGGKIHCGAGKTVSITQTVKLVRSGTYLVKAEIAPPTAPWTFTVDNDPNPLKTLTENKQEDAMVSITGDSSLSAGSSAKLRVILERKSPTTDSATFEFDIAP